MEYIFVSEVWSFFANIHDENMKQIYVATRSTNNIDVAREKKEKENCIKVIY